MSRVCEQSGRPFPDLSYDPDAYQDRAHCHCGKVVKSALMGLKVVWARHNVPAKKMIRVEILACNDCGRLNVCLGNETGGRRLGPHKCSGSWKPVSKFDLEAKDFKRQVRDALKSYAFTT